MQGSNVIITTEIDGNFEVKFNDIKRTLQDAIKA